MEAAQELAVSSKEKGGGIEIEFRIRGFEGRSQSSIPCLVRDGDKKEIFYVG